MFVREEFLMGQVLILKFRRIRYPCMCRTGDRNQKGTNGICVLLDQLADMGGFGSDRPTQGFDKKDCSQLGYWVN